MIEPVKKCLSLFGPFLGLVFVYGVFLFAAPEAFHSVYNTKTIVCQAVIFGIGALGMTVVIVGGGIDLSVGSMIALGTVVTGLVLRNLAPRRRGRSGSIVAAGGGPGRDWGVCRVWTGQRNDRSPHFGSCRSSSPWG